MRWARSIAFVEVGCALLCLGCSSPAKGEVGGCVVGSGPLPQCKTTFCSPVLQHVVVNDRDGGAQLKTTIAGTAPAGPYLGLGYTAPDAFLYLSFKVQPDGRPGAFDYLWMNVYFGTEQDGGPDARIYNQTPPFWGSQIWDRFEMADGRVKGTFKFEAWTAHQRIVSRSPDCVSGDTGGECYCEYKPLLIPVVVDVDVALPQ